MHDGVDTSDGSDLVAVVHMARDSQDEDDKGEENNKEDAVEDEDVVNSKEPRTIVQREMINSGANTADTMMDNRPIVLPAHDQEMREHKPLPQPVVPPTRLQCSERHPRPRSLETQTRSGLETLRVLTPQKPRSVSPSLLEAEADRNTYDVDVEQLLLGQLAGGDSLPDDRLPHVPLPNVLHSNGRLPDIRLVDYSLPEAHPDGLV
jgi:hypothetical protein